jgi:curved DNA-binding protein
VKDLYQALGLEPPVTTAEIKKAYRELTRRFHPDLNPGRQWAGERYKEVVSAYEVLCDQDRRALYDEFGEVAFTRGFDPDRAREARGQQPPTVEAKSADSGLWSRDVMDFADLEEVRRTGFDDFLELFFGGPTVVEEEEGLDLRATLTLRASEVIAGGTRRVRYRRADGQWTSTEVTIAPCTASSTQLRLSGLGEPGDPPGALMLELQVEADPGLRLEGPDIHIELDVPLHRLYAGGPVDVVVPFGRFEVKLPAATAPHKPLRLRGRGLPTAAGQRGDLIVNLRLRMPPAGDAELLAALRRLQGD